MDALDRLVRCVPRLYVIWGDSESGTARTLAVYFLTDRANMQISALIVMTSVHTYGTIEP